MVDAGQACNQTMVDMLQERFVVRHVAAEATCAAVDEVCSHHDHSIVTDSDFPCLARHTGVCIQLEMQRTLVDDEEDG